MRISKKAIALLITLFFIMAITVSIGIGLKYVNKASSKVKNENSMFQISVIIDDVLTLLKDSKTLELIVQDQSGEAFFIFLSESSFIPFESSGIKVSLELSSARSKFNPNTLMDNNGTLKKVHRVEALRGYMSRYMVNNVYVDILLDNMSKVKENFSYNTDIFNEKPYLFRDYIVSSKHLDELNSFYMQTTHENSLKNVNFENLFYFSKNRNTAIDLNYATVDVWELILGVDRQRAEQLIFGAGSYTDIESLSLSLEESDALSRFNVSYFEPYIDVRVEILQNDKSAHIRFEYNMKNKKGSNFSYDI